MNKDNAKNDTKKKTRETRIFSYLCDLVKEEACKAGWRDRDQDGDQSDKDRDKDCSGEIEELYKRIEELEQSNLKTQCKNTPTVNTKTFFAIIALHIKHDLSDATTIVGVFSSFADAEQSVLSNNGDIYEYGWHDQVVIEELDFGLYPFPHQQSFYKWSGDFDGKYVKYDKPHGYSGRNLYFY